MNARMEAEVSELTSRMIVLEDELKKLGLRVRPRQVGHSNSAMANSAAASSPSGPDIVHHVQPEKPGRISFDDRGNALYEWREEFTGDDEYTARQRGKALTLNGLSIVDEEVPATAAIQPNPKGLRNGYDPYASGMLSGKNKRAKVDLRELSKWVEAKRKVAENK